MFALQREVVGIVVQRADVVGIVHQCGVIGLVSGFVHRLHMVGIAHDGVEVGHYLLVALRRKVRQSLTARRDDFIRPLGLVVGDGQVEVELQHVGVGLDACLAEANDVLVILLPHGLAQQGHAGGGVRGVYLDDTFQHRPGLRVHALRQEVLSVEHRHVGIVRVLLHDAVEQGDDARTVLACLLVADNEPAHHVQLHLRLYFLVQQQRVELSFVPFRLAGLFVVVGQRVQSRGVVRLRVQHVAVDAVGFFLLPVVQVDVAQQHLVARVLGVLRH